jgi:type VI secretion system protein VasL
MTGLFEMRIRRGGDPCGFDEFTALRDELAKLSHPACPDVDWARVEQLCLTLFQLNGAELQTACAYALARSQRHGLEGMAQGVALIEALACQWLQLWPAVPSVRLGILAWLFTQLQPLLRGLELSTQSWPALVHLQTELERLNARLEYETQGPQVTLQALRQQVGSLMQRLERNSAPDETVPLSMRVPEPAFVMPIVILPVPRMPEVNTGRRRMAPWLFAGLATIALACGVGWWGWLAGPDQRLANLWQQEQTLPDPVLLDGLFDAGSAELKPGSIKVLVKALVDIKARPDWLIVITGHTDVTGDAEQNLKLSHARAWAVRSWMQRMGDIPESCFAVQGYAASQPIASNDTETGRTANRRVDIRLVPQEGVCG